MHFIFIKKAELVGIKILEKSNPPLTFSNVRKYMQANS